MSGDAPRGRALDEETGSGPPAAPPGIPPQARSFLIVNVVFFTVLLFADLAPHPGRFVALCAAAILSWNGGWFFFAAFAGGFPGDDGLRFGPFGRAVLAAFGLVMSTLGLLAVLSVALPPGAPRPAGPEAPLESPGGITP